MIPFHKLQQLMETTTLTNLLYILGRELEGGGYYFLPIFYTFE